MTDYFRWLELSATRDEPAAAARSPGIFQPEVESPGAASLPCEPVDGGAKARLCPECGRLLARHKVGHGVAFQIERCGTCGGTWLDAGEWESLRRCGLHLQLHRVFSPAWQAELTQRERNEAHAAMLLRKLGQDELAEVQRFGSWIRTRPRRNELLAVLLEEVREGIPYGAGCDPRKTSTADRSAAVPAAAKRSDDVRLSAKRAR